MEPSSYPTSIQNHPREFGMTQEERDAVIDGLSRWTPMARPALGKLDDPILPGMLEAAVEAARYEGMGA